MSLAIVEAVRSANKLSLNYHNVHLLIKLYSAQLIKLFSTFGLPGILLSDQGRNFESTIFKQALEAFGVTKVRKTAYHPQGNRMVE